MSRDRVEALIRLFSELRKGDPYAWGFVGFFIFAALGVGLIGLKVRRDMRREDEEFARKYGRRP